ncbi:MAG: DUF1311 domain-containing protein [Rhodobacteraceae bacterium]|nr:DUF1311 domain-containing protein [Paracoccaceae bacterium]
MKLAALILASLCVAVSAGPAPATDSADAPATDGVAVLKSCLEGKSNRKEEATCIHAVSDPCQAASDQTTLSLSRCQLDEIAAWDSLLNEFWPEVLALARQLDETYKMDGITYSEDGASVKIAREAQRAWIAFRDADCAWTYQRWLDGSIRVLMAGECQLDRTANRVLDFRDWVIRGE